MRTIFLDSRHWLMVLLGFAATIGTAEAADLRAGGQRVALVIGNGEYPGVTLPHVPASVARVSSSLKKQGFDVQQVQNLKPEAFRQTVDDFVQSVPTNGVAVVYYCGLAASNERFGKYTNWLRPVDQKLTSDSDYRKHGISVNDLIESLVEQSGAAVSLLFLDTGWKSSLRPATKSLSSGTRPMTTFPNTAIVMTADGEALQEIPESSAASPLAEAIGRHFGSFDNSASQALASIADDVGGVLQAPAELAIAGRDPAVRVAHPSAAKQAGSVYVNSLGQVFRWCPAGQFQMGSDETGTSSTRDRQAVDVTLSSGFFLGEYEVTQREYNLVAGRKVPNDFTQGKNIPYWGASDVKTVLDFCKKLTAVEEKAGRMPQGWEYACPTEAQWEYACRGGTRSRFGHGDNVTELGQYGNVADRSLLRDDPDALWADRRFDDGFGRALAPVGQFRPNAWGLRDLHGNVAEIVRDHYQTKLPGGTDPCVQLEKGGQPVLRGGAWCSHPDYSESSFRNLHVPGQKLNYVGFRIVLQKRR